MELYTLPTDNKTRTTTTLKAIETMERLISMTDFVLEQWEASNEHPQEHIEDSNYLRSVLNYGKLLKQPLNLSMFVPCKLVEGVWVVLEEPNKISYDLTDMYDWNVYNENLKEYQEAKDRVLFEGFEIDVFGYAYNGEIRIPFPHDGTVESYSDYNLQLTPTAKKQIGL